MTRKILLFYVDLAAYIGCDTIATVLPDEQAMNDMQTSVTIDVASSTGEGWPVYGHEWVVRLLQRAMKPVAQAAGQAKFDDGATSRLRHAYLLTGSQQVGKSTLAHAFAQSLLCTRADDGMTSSPCGECRACQLMVHGNHPDFRLIQPLDSDGNADRQNGTLRVEQAAQIIREVATSPMEGRYKFFLIQDFQRAHPSFANKLLKTLEEPPKHAVLCLTASDRNSLLPTIVSRCQVFDLHPVDTKAVAQALKEQWAVDEAEAELLARLSNGRLGWAVRQHEEPKGLARREEALGTLWQLVEADRIDRLAFATSLSSNRNNQQLFGMLELWSTWWRDIMLAQSGALDSCSNVDQLDEIQRQAHILAPRAVRQYLDTLNRTDGYLHHTVNIRLALDVLLLEMPQPLAG